MSRHPVYLFLTLCLLMLGFTTTAYAKLDEAQLAELVVPPYKLGIRDSDLPVWKLLDGGGAHAGYVFESIDLAPIPGFSGSPVNLLVSIDREGRFLDVQVLEQNEPVFVSGLGPRPLHEFVRQYEDKSLASFIKVRTANDRKVRDASANTYIDGVIKATASVRIVNQSILAAALKVARDRMTGVVPRPAQRPRKDIFKELDWRQLVDRGLVKNLRITNAEVEAAFAGSEFVEEDPEALTDPDGLYIDLWIADLDIPSVGRNLLSDAGMAELRRQVTSFEEPILLLANGRHRLVAEDFVRNSVPDGMAMRQGAFPVNLRDADAEIELRPGIPAFEQVMALRIDTRIGFNPAERWDFIIKAVRKIGAFQPRVGTRDLVLINEPDSSLFEAPKTDADANAPPWVGSWRDQAWPLAGMTIMLVVLSAGLSKRISALRRFATLRPLRLVFLGLTLGFIGWYTQGQLSIVTVLAAVRAAVDAWSLSFLLYDPVSLLLWGYVLVTLFVWGRGTFCGWLCPFGALQELLHALGRVFRLPQLRIPAKWDRQLVLVKYVALAALLIAVVISTTVADAMVEVEPFKTAITLAFDRAWPFVLYAAGLLALNLFVFKAFCRFLCPLGAALALPTRFFRFNWIQRRAECGTPCQLCKVRCGYGAIERSGGIDYSECFQCMACIAIHDDPSVCVPLVLGARKPRTETEVRHVG